MYEFQGKGRGGLKLRVTVTTQLRGPKIHLLLPSHCLHASVGGKEDQDEDEKDRAAAPGASMWKVCWLGIALEFSPVPYGGIHVRIELDTVTTHNVKTYEYVCPQQHYSENTYIRCNMSWRARQQESRIDCIAVGQPGGPVKRFHQAGLAHELQVRLLR